MKGSEMSIRRKGFLAGGAVAGLVLAASGLAWACTGVTSPYINLSPNRALAGTEVGLTGGNWIANNPVTVVWTSSGQTLGTPTASSTGALSNKITIPPNAAGGSYYVHATQSPDKEANTTFTVEVVGQNPPPANTPPPDNSTSAVSGNNSGAQTGQPTYIASPTNGSGGIPAQHAATPGSGGPGGNAGPGSGPSGPSGPPGPGGSSGPGGSAGPDSATGPDAGGGPGGGSGGAGGAPGFNSTVSPPAGNAATLAPVAQPIPVTNSAPAPVAAQPGMAPEPEATPAPAPRSATADLWSGFAGGTRARTPGLADLSGASTSGSSPMAMAVGVLSAGLVALAGGFGIAEAKRRRVTVAHRAD